MPLALLVETDPALSNLMQDSLERVGFEVRVCEKASWVGPALLTFNDIPNHHLLLVLSGHVARVQRGALLTALRTRFRSHETPLRTLLTADFASTEPLPDLRELDVAAVLEKPFSLDELERVAERIRLSMAYTLFPVE
jgi:DNA-binding response OmpR family regulator